MSRRTAFGSSGGEFEPARSLTGRCAPRVSTIPPDGGRPDRGASSGSLRRSGSIRTRRGTRRRRPGVAHRPEGTVDVVRHEQRLARAQPQDEALMPVAGDVIGENLGHGATPFGLEIALPLLEGTGERTVRLE